MKKQILFWYFLAILFTKMSFGADPPLSSLAATKNFPVYTTYAAALERSEFILDEGYHFTFYDSSAGPNFTTDTAGDWCLGFKRGAQYVYTLPTLFQEPIITASYPDLVKFFYLPFKDLRAEVIFLAYSSQIAVQDVTLRNTGTESMEFKVFPFLQNNYRTFDNIQLLRAQNAIHFTHEELPDAWTLEHQIPYIGKVYDAWLFSMSPDRLTSFRSYQWGNVDMPEEFDLNKKSQYVIWGRLSHVGGERCQHIDPTPKLQVVLNEDFSKILTETAPRWGSTDENINRYGYYGIELGNFGNIETGDRFSVMLECEQTDKMISAAGTIAEIDSIHDQRLDLVFAEAPKLAIPKNLKKDVWGSGTEIRLYWDKNPQVTFNVYRRDYRQGGVYTRIARGVTRNFFTDKNISGDQIFGYVVTAVNSDGDMSMHSREITNVTGSDFLTDVKYPDQITTYVQDLARVIAVEKSLVLAPGQSEHFRLIRTVARDSAERIKIIATARPLLVEDLTPYQTANEALFKNIPAVEFEDADKSLLYWSAFSLMRQAMLPPEGKCSYNYYVFSREPTWGWGHGGQVFHESLTMLAYAWMDPAGAMNSQRVYLERQHQNGYINYRTGPYLDETIPYNGQLTTSAPWYAWQNWEIYQVTGDDKFLTDMYASCKAFYHYYIANRDSDNDGLCEWGAHAVLESVRDGRVAVWDQVDWPSSFEALDLNCMLVSEANALAAMAKKLGKPKEALDWEKDALERKKRINERMWDDATGFYYHIDRTDHDFSYKNANDLKRQEIIGFLPLWAGVASAEQAQKLAQVLTDSVKFWRLYGLPTLAADDSYYNARGYWNGPVWVQWVYLIERGLKQYGYHQEARDLVERVAANMIAQLKQEHTFWEFYSPDEPWGGYHQTYIWAGLIARMLLDVR